MLNFGGDFQKSLKKIHWTSWKKLCLSKELGGMGFKQVSIFNQAMLAKQSWRIMKNQESLVAQILRGKYFVHGNFMQAKLGRTPCYV